MQGVSALAEEQGAGPSMTDLISMDVSEGALEMLDSVGDDI